MYVIKKTVCALLHGNKNNFKFKIKFNHKLLTTLKSLSIVL